MHIAFNKKDLIRCQIPKWKFWLCSLMIWKYKKAYFNGRIIGLIWRR